MNIKIETEAKIKLSFHSFEKIISILGKPNFMVQRNDFFQNISGERIRWRAEDGRIILNRKTGINYPTKFKSKKEEEIILSNKEEETIFWNKEAENILLFFGFKKVFSYEKERANFDWKNCMVSLDKLGNNRYYVEIEGEEKDIEEVIRRLNLEDKPLEKRSYFELLGDKNGVH